MKYFITLFLILFLVFILLTTEFHCKKCRRVFARKLVGKKVVSTKTKEEYGWNPKKEEDTKIKVKYKTMKYQYQCKYCNYKWAQKKVVEA